MRHAYANGVAKPISIMINPYHTGKLPDGELITVIRNNFDLPPESIIEMLELHRPIYKQTSAYGHLGRTDLDLPWEKLDRIESLKKYL